MISSLRRGLSENLNPAMESLLEGGLSRKYRWLAVLWLVGLYVLGIVGFGLFFDWGNFSMEYHDWAMITGPRLQFLRTVIREGQLPLHISDAETFHSATVRYLAVPDAVISPQYLLLYKLPLPLFSLVNTWLLYTLGFAGLLVLLRKLRLSPASFTVLFLLFNFNGHILAHFSVGHMNWGGYFLFPWFAWLVFRLLEGDRSWLWTALTSLLLFITWLQGSYHQYLWLLILLAGIGIFVPRTFWMVTRTGLVAFLVCAFRLLPCILLYQIYKQGFFNGYPSLFSIWDNLVNITEPVGTPFYVNTMLGTAPGEWELTAFVGLLGALFLVYFGIYRGLLHREAPYRALLVPLGIILLLSLGPVYQILLNSPIPLLQGERVSARMFSLVLAFGLILGAERSQRWLDSSPQKSLSLGGSLLGLAIIGVELWQNARIWWVNNRDPNFWIYFDRFKWYVKNDYSDTIYLWLVFGGLAISIISILVLVGLSWRENRAAQPLIKKVLIVLLHAFTGWGISGAILVIGWKITSLSSALIMHAILAPILYGIIAWGYFSRFAFTKPLPTALIFLGTVFLMDTGIMGLFVENGFTIFVRSWSTWIAFAMIFAVTYQVGITIIRRKKFVEPA
jgi:hypothetical protein